VGLCFLIVNLGVPWALRPNSPVLLRSCPKRVLFFFGRELPHVRDHNTAEMITIRFAGWISGRIVSFQPDMDIQKLLSNGNQIRNRISETLSTIFRGFRLLEKLHIAQSFIYYSQKHLFSFLCHGSESVCGLFSVP